MNKQYIQILLIVTLFFIFLPGLILPIPYHVYPIFLFVVIGTSIFMGVTHYKFIHKKIFFLYKETPFRYLVYFIFWLFFSTLILICIRKADFLVYYRIIVYFLPRLLLCYLLAALYIPKYISLKQITKILYYILYFILIWGIFQYIGEQFNIGFITKCINTLSNWKEVAQGVTEMTDAISGKIRIRSVFHEPGAFANFICVMLPIIYKISLGRYSVNNNTYINFIIKKSAIPLSWFCLFLTQSPIYLIFSLIVTFVYFYKSILNIIRKNFIKCLFLFSIVFLLTYILYGFIDDYIKQSYLLRIVNSLQNINNIDALIKVEKSLSARICFVVTQMELFTKSPILGFGYDNIRFYIYDVYLQTSFPLADEIIQSIIDFQTGKYNSVQAVKVLLTALLTETGIVGTILYYLFLLKNIKIMSKICKYFNGLERNLAIGLLGSYYTIIFLSFYWNSMMSTFVCFMYGLTCSYIYVYQRKRKLILKLKEQECIR